jgi:hypothetical protein
MSNPKSPILNPAPIETPFISFTSEKNPPLKKRKSIGEISTPALTSGIDESSKPNLKFFKLSPVENFNLILSLISKSFSHSGILSPSVFDKFSSENTRDKFLLNSYRAEIFELNFADLNSVVSS